MIYHYAHMDRFADREVKDYKEYDGKLIIYGAGRIGIFAAYALNSLSVSFVCYCDSNPMKNGTQLHEHFVISPEELLEKYPDAPVLIATGRHREVYAKLTLLGYSQIYDCVSLFDGIDFDNINCSISQKQIFRLLNRYYSTMDKIYTGETGKYSSFVVLVNEKCTLRCLECSSLMQYFDAPVDYNFEDMKTSVSKVLSSVEYFDRVKLFG